MLQYSADADAPRHSPTKTPLWRLPALSFRAFVLYCLMSPPDTRGHYRSGTLLIPRRPPMAKPLTPISIKALRPRPRRYEVPDGGCAGLKIVIFPSGKK